VADFKFCAPIIFSMGNPQPSVRKFQLSPLPTFSTTATPIYITTKRNVCYYNP